MRIHAIWLLVLATSLAAFAVQEENAAQLATQAESAPLDQQPRFISKPLTYSLRTQTPITCKERLKKPPMMSA